MVCRGAWLICIGHRAVLSHKPSGRNGPADEDMRSSISECATQRAESWAATSSTRPGEIANLYQHSGRAGSRVSTTWFAPAAISTPMRTRKSSISQRNASVSGPCVTTDHLPASSRYLEVRAAVRFRSTPRCGSRRPESTARRLAASSKS